MLKASPHISEESVESQSCEEMAEGKHCALQELFDQEESALLRYAFSLTGRRAVAEEIVQEVFLRLHAKWDDVDDPRRWLFRSVRNNSLNHLRGRRREILGADGPESTDHKDGAEMPDAVLGRLEAVGKLRGLLSTLDLTDQELIRLKYFENKKYREMSEITGLSVGNVGYRLHHILKNLAEQLRREGVESDQ